MDLDTHMFWDNVEPIDWFCGLPFGEELYMENLK
jgi:hypothetical protein